MRVSIWDKSLNPGYACCVPSGDCLTPARFIDLSLSGAAYCAEHVAQAALDRAGEWDK